ncbi:MAG TPA: cysteine--tRNA ligase [Acidothermaceae bacterium]
MTLRIYDTASRQLRDFEPIEPGRVSIYLCGATVQAPPHIGHVRSAVAFDVLARWLSASGHRVVLCRNVTDIDDKILAVAAAAGVPYWEIAQRNQRLFTDAYAALGCQPPTVEPHATGHVPEMIVLMRRLIEAGHAYAVDGDVYFSVRSFPAYGALSGQDPKNLQQGESDVDTKRDPLDFALWKNAKSGEPSWETPWGSGRPGWHLECSAMATKYLGARFDIHGGGLDLVFPHHENEQAQSRAAGDGFANFWMHNGLVTLGGDKMSKSLGNTLSVGNLLDQVRPSELRYYLAAPHYRSSVDFTAAALEEAAVAYRRVEGFVERALELVGAGLPSSLASLTLGSFPAAFVDAMNDDIGVPQGLAVLHNTVREGNAALADGDKARVGVALRHVLAMLSVLGLDPVGDAASGVSDLHLVVDRLVALALEQRTAARERKDYAAADAIRDQLAEAGIIVEDTAAGARWQLRRD